MLALISQSGNSSGAALGVRSVALLQVAKPTDNLSYTKGILKVYKGMVIYCSAPHPSANLAVCFSILGIWYGFCEVHSEDLKKNIKDITSNNKLKKL